MEDRYPDHWNGRLSSAEYGILHWHRVEFLAPDRRQLALLRRHHDRPLAGRDTIPDLRSNPCGVATLGKSRDESGFNRDAPRRNHIFVRAVASGVHILFLRRLGLLFLSPD